MPKFAEAHRIKTGPQASCKYDGPNGAFVFPPCPAHAVELAIIACDGGGWDHVSVSTASRGPTWEEMSYVKDLFFGPEEVVMQLHPAQAHYVNVHATCLHLWRPQDQAIPLPPTAMV